MRIESSQMLMRIRGKQQMRAQLFVALPPSVGDAAGVPVFWLCPGTVLAIADTFVVKHLQDFGLFQVDQNKSF